MNTKTYVISDTHFRHENIIKYCNRPFTDAAHMTEILVNNWNQVVKPEDEVIHNGDFALGDSAEKAWDIRRRLNGRLTLIRGNHDHKKFWNYYLKNLLDGDTLCDDPIVKRLGHLDILFSHYPTDTAPRFTYHIHGHIHQRVLPDPKKFNVSVENIGYYPMLLDDIIYTFEENNCGPNRGNETHSDREGTV